MSQTASPSGLPPVDFNDWAADFEGFSRRLGDSFVRYGFCVIAHHDLDLARIDRALAAGRAFFALPEDVKRRYVTGAGGQRGYTPFGVETARDSQHFDLKEFWHVGQDKVSGELAKLYPQNVWPEEIGPFRHTILEIYRALDRCALQMLRATALYLQLEENHFSSMAEQGNSVLRIIHYPPVPENANPSAVRAAEHEDINLITLLCEASTGGLEIKTRDGKWLPIRSLDGQIVCDAGDMLQLATNGVIPATTHRAVNPGGEFATTEISKQRVMRDPWLGVDWFESRIRQLDRRAAGAKL